MINFSEFKKLFIFSLIGSLIVAAIVAVIAVLIGEFNEITTKVFLTLAMVIIHSLVSLAFIWDDTKRNTFSRLAFFINIAFILIVASFIISLFGVWEIIPSSTVGKLYSTLFILGFAALHLDILSKILGIKSYMNIIIYVNYVFILIVTLMLQPVFYMDNAFKYLGDIYYRFLAAASIIDGTLSILTVIFYKLYMHQHPELKNIFQNDALAENGQAPKRGISIWIWILIIYFVFQIIFPLFSVFMYMNRLY